MDWQFWLFMAALGGSYAYLEEAKKKTTSDEGWARLASVAAWLAVAGTVYVILIGVLPTACLLDAVILGVLAIGVRRMSRSAALLLLAYYVLNQVYWIMELRRLPDGAHFAIVFASVFVAGVRATFRHHWAKATPAAA